MVLDLKLTSGVSIGCDINDGSLLASGERSGFMEPQQVLRMLEQVASGSISPAAAQSKLVDQGYTDLGFAKVDTDRARRTGAGEVVYGAGKTADQIADICLALHSAGQACVLVTRLEAQKAQAVRAAACPRPAGRGGVRASSRSPPGSARHPRKACVR